MLAKEVALKAVAKIPTTINTTPKTARIMLARLSLIKSIGRRASIGVTFVADRAALIDARTVTIVPIAIGHTTAGSETIKGILDNGPELIFTLLIAPINPIAQSTPTAAEITPSIAASSKTAA